MYPPKSKKKSSNPAVCAPERACGCSPFVDILRHSILAASAYSQSKIEVQISKQIILMKKSNRGNINKALIITYLERMNKDHCIYLVHRFHRRDKPYCQLSPLNVYKTSKARSNLNLTKQNARNKITSKMD